MPHMLGASAGEAGQVLDALAAASRQGRASAFWCDGSDAVAVVGDDDDGPADVRRLFQRLVGEVQE